MPAPESFVVRIQSGERLHYLDWGGPDDPSRPPLVLLHGITQTAWIWAPVARRLAETHRVVAPDLRGHGLSDTPRSGYDLDSLALDMLTVVSGNGWGEDAGGRAVVVAGHGIGGIVAARMAALRPGTVAGLALVDGGWESLADATRLSPNEYLAAIAEPPEVLRSMDVFLADRRDFDPSTWDDDQERAARAQVDQKHAGHVGLVSRPLAVKATVEGLYTFEPIETLAQVPARITAMVAEAGTPDDEDLRERLLALDELAAARRSAARSEPRVLRLSGAGHNLMRYRPAEVTQALLELTTTAYQRA